MNLEHLHKILDKTNDKLDNIKNYNCMGINIPGNIDKSEDQLKDDYLRQFNKYTPDNNMDNMNNMNSMDDCKSTVTVTTNMPSSPSNPSSGGYNWTWEKQLNNVNIVTPENNGIPGVTIPYIHNEYFSPQNNPGKEVFEKMLNWMFSYEEKIDFLVNIGYTIRKRNEIVSTIELIKYGEKLLFDRDGNEHYLSDLDNVFLKEALVKFKNLLLMKSVLKMKL